MVFLPIDGMQIRDLLTAVRSLETTHNAFLIVVSDYASLGGCLQFVDLMQQVLLH